MHNKDVAKITKFFQEVTAIIEQLKDVLNDDTSVCYQLQTTLYHKLNHKARDKWCDLTLKIQNPTSRLGHNLTAEDFLNCIETTRSEIRINEEFNQKQKMALKSS